MSKKAVEADVVEVPVAPVEDVIDYNDARTADMKWFTVQVQTNCEKKASENVRIKFANMGIEDSLGHILIPVEKSVEMRNGKQRVVEKKLYPSYVFIKMDMNENSWHAVKDTNRVLGFVGDRKNGNTPPPMSRKEIEPILARVSSSSSEEVSFNVPCVVGDTVRVLDGPFKEFEGVVDQVDTKKGELLVQIAVFGRPTPVNLSYNAIEKVS